MDLARLKQMFLIALQSTQDGEALSALRRAVKDAKAGGLDVHALADRLTGKVEDPLRRVTMDQIHQLEADRNSLAARVGALLTENRTLRSEATALTNEIYRLKQNAAARPVDQPRPATPTHELDWRRRAQQLLDVGDLSDWEEGFLNSILTSGWSTLTDKQQSKLNALWQREVG